MAENPLDTALALIAADDWFITRLTHIHATLWLAHATSTGRNPNVGHSALGEGTTPHLAILNLLSNLNAGELIPPTIATPPIKPAFNLLAALGISEPAALPKLTRRI